MLSAWSMLCVVVAAVRAMDRESIDGLVGSLVSKRRYMLKVYHFWALGGYSMVSMVFCLCGTIYGCFDVHVGVGSCRRLFVSVSVSVSLCVYVYVCVSIRRHVDGLASIHVRVRDLIIGYVQYITFGE